MKNYIWIALIAVSGMFTSCSDPLDYQEVQDARKKEQVQALPEINPLFSQYATVVGQPERLTGYDRVKATFSEARIPVVLEGSLDTIYASVDNARRCNFMNMGDILVVTKNKKHSVTYDMGTMPDIVIATVSKKTERSKLLGGGYELSLKVGNGFEEIKIPNHTDHDKVPVYTLSEGDKVSLRNGWIIDKKI